MSAPPYLVPATHRRPRATAVASSQRRDITEDQRQEIHDAFNLFDLNKDGHIDYHELKVALRALGFEVKKQEVLSLLRDYDKDGHNLMDYESFYKVGTFFFFPCWRDTRSLCLRGHTQASEKVLARDPIEEIRKAFSLFDDEQTGAFCNFH